MLRMLWKSSPLSLWPGAGRALSIHWPPQAVNQSRKVTSCPTVAEAKPLDFFFLLSGGPASQGGSSVAPKLTSPPGFT